MADADMEGTTVDWTGWAGERGGARTLSWELVTQVAGGGARMELVA